jgi:hypothetical protein
MKEVKPMSDVTIIERLVGLAQREFNDPEIESYTYDGCYYVPVGPKQMGSYTWAPLKWVGDQWRLCLVGAPGELYPCTDDCPRITGTEGDLSMINLHMCDNAGD